LTEWHLITGEYPPQFGGVSDYTRRLALALAAAGDVVHVWCPRCDKACSEDSGVIVHRDLGDVTPRDLLRVSRMLNKYSGPRRLLVQWVPHAFGFHSANVPLSLWIWNRAFAHNDCVEVLVHEPFLPLPQQRLRHTVLAVAHRIMLAMVLRAAARIWVAIPKWEECCRPYARPSARFTWLPVTSNIPVQGDTAAARAVRSDYAASQQYLIGHFGSCGGAIGTALRAIVPELLNRDSKRVMLLIGADGEITRGEIVREHPQLLDRIHVSGLLSAEDVSSHISACDVMVQPYPDGVSSRRCSLMAAISHGKPVITTIGRLTEPIWSSSGAVLLCRPEDYSDITAAVESLLANRAERLSLGRQARDFYDRHFDLSNLVNTFRNDGRTFSDLTTLNSKETVSAGSANS